MSIAVCAIVNDGIVLGSDSAATTHFEDGSLQTYGRCQKVFPLHEQAPLGAIVIGLSDIAGHSIANLMFELSERLQGRRPDQRTWRIDPASVSVEEVAERLRQLLYDETYRPAIEEMNTDHPLVCYLAGYSRQTQQPEFIEYGFQSDEVIGPTIARPENTARITYGGTYEGALRLDFGFSPELPAALTDLGIVTEDEIQNVMQKVQERIRKPMLFPGTPLAEAARVVNFLVETQIQFSGFTPDPDLVGGAVQLATISPRSGFRWLHHPEENHPD
ncbi:MAG: hypothetical protein ACF8TS_19230 [Maioricimonas sp. JB049]